MRDVAARTAAQVELLEPSPCQPQRVERAPPAQGPAVVAAHRQFKQIGDRAFLHHEGAGHIGFAELELGLEQDRDLGAPAGKPGRDRGAGSVAEGQDRPACGGQPEGSTTDHSRDQCAQQPVHGASPQRQGRRGRPDPAGLTRRKPVGRPSRPRPAPRIDRFRPLLPGVTDSHGHK